MWCAADTRASRGVSSAQQRLSSMVAAHVDYEANVVGGKTGKVISVIGDNRVELACSELVETKELKGVGDLVSCLFKDMVDDLKKNLEHRED